MTIDLDAIRARRESRDALIPVGSSIVRLSQHIDGDEVAIIGRRESKSEPSLENTFAIIVEGIHVTRIEAAHAHPTIPAVGDMVIFFTEPSESPTRGFYGRLGAIHLGSDGTTYDIRVHISPADWGLLEVIAPSANQDIDDLIAEVEKLKRGR